MPAGHAQRASTSFYFGDTAVVLYPSAQGQGHFPRSCLLALGQLSLDVRGSFLGPHLPLHLNVEVIEGGTALVRALTLVTAPP